MIVQETVGSVLLRILSCLGFKADYDEEAYTTKLDRNIDNYNELSQKAAAYGKRNHVRKYN